jgi:WD40 repeat protein
LWDAVAGKEIAVLRGHNGPLLCAAFSPDGSRIVTGSKGDTARLWDVTTGKEILVLRAHKGDVRALHHGDQRGNGHLCVIACFAQHHQGFHGDIGRVGTGQGIHENP